MQNIIKTRVVLTWVETDFSAEKYEIQGSYENGEFVSFGDYIRATNTRLEDMPTGEWTFRVRAVNSVGFTSDWNTIVFNVVGKTAAPSDVPTLTAIQMSYGNRSFMASCAGH